MTVYSSSRPGKPAPAKFKKYQTREVATSLTEAKKIAEDLSAAKRWVHRAHVSVIGNALVKPYQPIYLDGLPNGLSGYWTVLSVRHTFGGIPAKYLLELEVGTDVIGEVNPDASKAVPIRDVQAEISGQSAAADSEPTLLSINLSPNSSSLNDNSTAVVDSSTVTSAPRISIPTNITNNIYSTKAPNFKVINNSANWRAPLS